MTRFKALIKALPAFSLSLLAALSASPALAQSNNQGDRGGAGGQFERGGQKQVLIQAAIVETTAQFTRDLGIDLPFSGIGDTAVQSGRPAGKPPVSVTVFEADRGPTSTAVTPPWGAIILDFSALDIAKIIAAIGKQHAVVLSEPRLVTSSGRPASFLAGGEIPFQKATDSTTRFREFGVQLNFVPTIVGKSLIRLKVEVEVDVGALGAEGGNSGLAGRRASTQVQMRAGQTLVVGGLLTDPVTVKQDRVPFFADIPAVGSLFQRKERSATMKSRLLIFVTAELAR